VNLLRKTEVLLSGDHTDGVGVALAAAPALHTDDVVALVDDTELETVRDTPLETTVDILLPNLDIEVGLPLGEEEGPDATVQVRILRQVSQHARATAVSAKLTREATGLRETMMMGQTGRYLEIMRAVFPLCYVSKCPREARQERMTNLLVRTTIAPALSSRLALTAAMAMDSTVSVGRGARLRSSSNTLK